MKVISQKKYKKICRTCKGKFFTDEKYKIFCCENCRQIYFELQGYSIGKNAGVPKWLRKGMKRNAY